MRSLLAAVVALGSLTAACANPAPGAQVLVRGPLPTTSTLPPPTAPPAIPPPSTTGPPVTPSAPPPPTSGAQAPQTAGTGTDDAPVVISPRGVVAPVVSRGPSGWVVRTPCGSTATLARATPVRHAAVVLDAGHGGDEPGAVGPGGVAEAPVNMAVVRHARAVLEQAGVPVVLTRTAEYRMTLALRAEVATALRPRAFVSVHHNAEPDGPWPRPGTETYYQIGNPDSKRLAGLIYEEVVRALSVYDLPWVADRDAGAKYRPNDRGGDYYAVLRLPATVTSVLAELAFVSNPPEAALVSRPDVQQVEGEAVARGILRYLNTSDPGSGYTEPYPREEPAGGGGGGRGCQDPPL